MRELKKELDYKLKAKPIVNADLLDKILTETRKNKPKTIEEVIELVANMLQPTMQMNDEQAEEFRWLVGRVIKDYGME